jgi:hypothetical protein
MAIAIQPYSAELIPAVRAFNQRLAAGRIAGEFRFPESNIPHWLPKLEGRRIYQEYYLAVDGDAVRGGFILKFQDFFVEGKLQPVVYYHLPVSEGIVNKAYAGVGAHMLRSALKLQPMLFALGMGGLDRPLPQMLKALGWGLCAVPFYFRINNAAKFLREIEPLRRNKSRRLLAGLAAGTGLGKVGVTLVNAMRTKRRLASGISCQQFDTFSERDNDLWQKCCGHYKLIAGRDCKTVNILYLRNKNFFCLGVNRDGKPIGWAVTLDSQMHDNKYFGNLRLGSIVDCLALPEDAPAVIHAATRFLEQRGVDLTISNQSHHAWCDALRSAGYLQARSNFIFAASKPLAEVLAPLQENQRKVFLNRGDGDGPINL